VIVAAAAWAAGSLRSRVAPSPTRPLVAASMEMLGASLVFVVVAAVTGEFRSARPGGGRRRLAAALAYLTTFGSIVAFTATAGCCATRRPRS
jgi:hypothetical protein